MKTQNTLGVVILVAGLLIYSINLAVSQTTEQISRPKDISVLAAQAPQQPSVSPAPPAGSTTAGESAKEAVDASSIEIERPTTTLHEVSVSGDYLYGQGNVTFPFGFSLVQAGFALQPSVDTPDRKSDYFGGTVSYSFGQAWFVDVSYAHGNSSGNFDIPFGGGPSLFTIDDDWYQAYVRYNPRALRGTRFTAYLRAGASFVNADLKDVSDAQGFYEQKDQLKDILGNVGFGLGYSFPLGRRIKLGPQLEAEGFYGHRSQDTQETLFGDVKPAVSIDNDLFGGIGRMTLRFQQELGQSGLKLFVDVGMSVKYTRIQYSDFGIGTRDELLWGPYAKIGLRYSF